MEAEKQLSLQALDTQVEAVLSALPPSLLDMKASEFLTLCNTEFGFPEKYNLSLEPQTGVTFSLLGSMFGLLDQGENVSAKASAGDTISYSQRPNGSDVIEISSNNNREEGPVPSFSQQTFGVVAEGDQFG